MLPIGIIYLYSAKAVVIELALNALPEFNSVVKDGGRTNRLASLKISCNDLTYYSAILILRASLLSTPLGDLIAIPIHLRVSTVAEAS